MLDAPKQVVPKSIKSIYIGGNLCANDIYSNNIYMKKSELKALIKEVIEEISTNEPATNPSYIDVKVGDRYVGKNIHRVGNVTWVYVSTVLAVGPVEKRFGKDDKVVTVRVETYDMEQGKMRSVVDNKKQIWVSQLLQGLV